MNPSWVVKRGYGCFLSRNYDKCNKYDKARTKTEDGRLFYEGLTGAAIWKRKEGEAFIKEMKVGNLELAEVESTIKRIEGV